MHPLAKERRRQSRIDTGNASERERKSRRKREQSLGVLINHREIVLRTTQGENLSLSSGEIAFTSLKTAKSELWGY